MWNIIAVALFVVVILALLTFKRRQSAQRYVDIAIRTGDIAPIVEAAEPLPQRQRSLFFQDAISLLWNNWQRRMAAQVVREFAARHYQEKIAQFWLRQVLEVEPETAGEILDEKFLSNYYQPSVAATCGRASS
jgi:hypothetical protein